MYVIDHINSIFKFYIHICCTSLTSHICMFNNAPSVALNSMSLHLLLLHITHRFYNKRSHKNVHFTIKSALEHYKNIMKIKI